jgi:TP53 regulating kinase-like protein
LALIIAKGAEADIALIDDWNGVRVAVKRRGAKKYRHPVIDAQVRRLRTIHEAEIMHRVKAAGVLTPLIYQIDAGNAEIVMEYVEGEKIRDLVPKLGDEELQALFTLIGAQAGRLHGAGVVHGDLTTSNMIRSGNRIVFIDFGLGEVSTEVEKRGVDIHLMERMLSSTHYLKQGLLLAAFHAGYRDAMGSEADNVLQRVAEIQRRGRYTAKD